MNKVRSILFSAIVVISSSTLALGGEMQFPGRSDPPPPLPAASTESTNDSATAQTSTEEIQIFSPDLAALLSQVLVTIY